MRGLLIGIIFLVSGHTEGIPLRTIQAKRKSQLQPPFQPQQILTMSRLKIAVPLFREKDESDENYPRKNRDSSLHVELMV